MSHALARARGAPVAAATASIPASTPTAVAAPSLLLGDDASSLPGGTRDRFERTIREAQDAICSAIAAEDGTPFREDSWTREGGGGGITRVLQGGNVWEKAGVNVSVVYGKMPESAYRAASAGKDGLGGATSGSAAGLPPASPASRNVAGDNNPANATASAASAASAADEAAGLVPFFAAGISSVMHPRNPHCPTMHFNFRYFETGSFKGNAPRWWFGGGADITPSYLVEDDVAHFHRTLKAACDGTDPAYYPLFKRQCDEYFRLPHRGGETRGLGGVFYDDLADRAQGDLVSFSRDLAAAIVPAYLPIIQRHRNDPFTDVEKRWQQLRRGRYVEFNLVYDRGTTFGLRTGGRTESILMSLPLTAQWEYDAEPEEGSKEADFLKAAREPRDWV